MAVTAEQFADYIGGLDFDNPKLILVLSVAESKVYDYIKSTFATPGVPSTSTIPVEIVDLSILKVADELWNQRNKLSTPREQMDFGGGMLSTMNRDPMLPAYSLLRGYVLPW